MKTSTSADERFALLTQRFGDRDGVDLGGKKKGFGSDALRVHGRIFAMVSGEDVVLKLPAGVVTTLIDEARGAPFDAGKGRRMREWVRVVSASDERLIELAEEALGFVASGGRRE